MSHIDDTQLRRLDLTLLLVFEEVMARGTLSAAAKRLGLTQSAISHALKRLRAVFEDDLFVRTPRGVQPTPRALALRPPLLEAIRLIGGSLRPASFDPATDQRVFRITAPDYETILFAPLLAAIKRPAPQIVFQPLVRRRAIDALLAAEIDLALGYTWDRSGGCQAELLYDEDYLVVARRDHPLLKRPLTLERYSKAEHVLTAPGGSSSGIVDRALSATGRTRRVALSVPYFLATLAIVGRTDLIATVPRRIALAHAGSFKLATVKPPLALRPFAVRMIWNKRAGSDPAITWLRDQVTKASRQIAA
jgi:DNA-binding transcriptional LysR family regulator